MAEKNFNNVRIVNKHDTEANWLKATGFTPKQGELIVYDIDDNYDYERIKIGDGVQNVNDLPFAVAPNINQIDLSDGIINIWEYNTGVYIFTASTTTSFKIYVKTGDEETKMVTVVSNLGCDKNILAVINVDVTDSYQKYTMQYMHDANAGVSACSNTYNSSGWTYEKTTVPMVVSTTHTYKENMFLCNSGSASAAYWSELPAADSELSDTSENAVQNKVVNEAISNLNTLVGDTAVSEQIEAAQIVYVGPDEPTDPNIKVWVNTAEEGTGVVPVLPRVATITLSAASWTGSASPYSQVVEINTVTTATKIELNPTVSQIVSLQNDDIALMAENDAGVVTIYSFGGKPSADMTMQVTLTEVSYV